MNPVEIYHDVIKPPTGDVIKSQQDKIKASRDNLAAWTEWRRAPQTQLFIKILEESQSNILKQAMASDDSKRLREANTIDKILNSVMINGTYEQPSN